MFRTIIELAVVAGVAAFVFGLVVVRRRLEEQRLADDPVAQASHIIRASRRGR